MHLFGQLPGREVCFFLRWENWRPPRGFGYRDKILRLLENLKRTDTLQLITKLRVAGQPLNIPLMYNQVIWKSFLGKKTLLGSCSDQYTGYRFPYENSVGQQKYRFLMATNL